LAAQPSSRVILHRAWVGPHLIFLGGSLGAGSVTLADGSAAVGWPCVRCFASSDEVAVFSAALFMELPSLRALLQPASAGPKPLAISMPNKSMSLVAVIIFFSVATSLER
jgi:hypothetical protein